MMIYQGFWNYACDLIQIPIQESITYICLWVMRGEWVAWLESGISFVLDHTTRFIGK